MRHLIDREAAIAAAISASHKTIMVMKPGNDLLGLVESTKDDTDALIREAIEAVPVVQREG